MLREDKMLARIRELEIELDHVHHMTVPQRIVCALKRHCAEWGLNHQNFTMRCTKTALAVKNHITVETFSRTIAKLPGLGVQLTNRNVSLNLPMIRCKVCDQCAGRDHCYAYASMKAEGPTLPPGPLAFPRLDEGYLRHTNIATASGPYDPAR